MKRRLTILFWAGSTLTSGIGPLGAVQGMPCVADRVAKTASHVGAKRYRAELVAVTIQIAAPSGTLSPRARAASALRMSSAAAA